MSAHDALFTGRGATAALMRSHDWAASPLGRPHTWQPGLRTAIDLMLAAHQPMHVAWGPSLTSFYNDSYIPIVGAKHPGGFGSSYAELWSHVWDEFRPVVEATLAGESHWFEDRPIKLTGESDGVTRWFSFSYTPLRDDEGRIAGFFCAATETTDKILMTQRLELERENFAQLFEQAPTFMAMLRGPEHRIELANPGYLRLVGPRDVIGKTVAQALPEAVEQGYVSLLDEVYRSGKAFAANGSKYMVQTDPGAPPTERFVDFVYQPIKNATGAVTGIFVEGVDVSERARTDAALRASEAHLRELNADLETQVLERSAIGGRFWQISPDLLGVLGADGYLQNANPAWRTELGWTETELRGKPLFELLHPDDLERTQAGFERLMRGEPILHFENRYRHMDGHYEWFSWSAAPLGGAYYCSGRSITFEKAQTEALAQSNAERDRVQDALRQSQKMEAIGQLTGGVAHDFNNLLQILSANLQLIGKHAGGNEKIEQRVQNALGAVKRGATLANQLLAFGRRQALDPRVIHVGKSVVSMEDMLRRTLGESIELEVVVSGGLWNTLADPAQTENAILNLAINARDAMGGAGRLTIEVGNAFLDAAYARRQIDVVSGQYVVVAVSDVGGGMEPHVVAQAFEPFFTTKAAGTGLGLSMVYGFAKQSGGHVKIYSEIGQGTVVKLYLPRVQQDEDAVKPVDIRAAVGGSETILVVEDDEGVRTTTVEMLGELGYRVLKASDAASALTVIESGAPIDMLFTDVVMPGPMRSTELARKARDRRPDIAVLFTSGYTQNAIVHGGRLDAGVELLAKPYSREELAHRIRSLLDIRGASLRSGQHVGNDTRD